MIDHPEPAAGPTSKSQDDALQNLYRESEAALRAPDLRQEQWLIDERIRLFSDLNWPTPCTLEGTRSEPDTSQPGTIRDIDASELSCKSLKQGIMDNGGLIVRGLIKGEIIDQLKRAIDHSFDGCFDWAQHVSDDKPYSSPWFHRSEKVGIAKAQFGATDLTSAAKTGYLWAVDSPRLSNQLIGLYRQLQLDHILFDYFREHAVLSVKKWVLRRVQPEKNANAGWHQDGRFLGENIQSVNLWLALSDCGGKLAAPGLEILPSRSRTLYETGTEGAHFNWTVGQGVVDQLSVSTPVISPEFKAGDALFFDHFNLHRTGYAGHHTEPRYAIESWFFGASGAPAKQTPLVF